MKILLIGSFLHPMYAPAFETGFKELGHDVKVIKYEDFQYGSGVMGSLLLRLQSRFHIGYKLLAYNRKIIEEAEEFCPDFIFLYRCYNIWSKTVRNLKEKGNIIFTYNNDDPFSGTPNLGYYRNFKSILPYADVNFIYRKKNIEDYENVGARNMRLLLPYYIGRNNYFIECEKDIPLAFLGHFENDGRDLFILKLKEEGLPVVVYGDEKWKGAPLYNKIKDIVFPAKRGEAYNETINHCRVCLVFFSKLNHDTYTRRCFEIPAAKGVMLCEYTDDMNELFPEGECAVYFRNVQELVEKAHFLLEHPDEAGRISENAYNRLKELGGSEYDRCQEIIDEYNKFNAE